MKYIEKDDHFSAQISGKYIGKRCFMINHVYTST